MDSIEFITTEEIVAEGVEYLGVTSFTKGVGRSFYELIVHRAVEDLALHTFFQVVTKDVYNWNCGCGSSCSGGTNGILPLPKNMFNVKEIYLFNSQCDSKRQSTSGCGCSSQTVPGNSDTVGGDEIGCCKNKDCWQYFVEAHWARTFNRFGSSGIKTKTLPGFGHDPVHGKRFWGNSGSSLYGGCLVYFGIQTGNICISDSGFNFKNMRIVANGFGTDNCELPLIPRPLRQVCVDLLKYKGALKLMVLYPEYKAMYQAYKNDLYGDGSNQNPGSWLRAERHVKSLNTKQRNDMSIYYGNIDIK